MQRGLVAKRKEHVGNRRDQRGVIPTGKIGGANRSGEERVTHKQLISHCRSVRLSSAWPDLQTDAPRAVAGRVVRPNLIVAEPQHIVFLVKMIDWGRRFHPDAV